MVTGPQLKKWLEGQGLEGVNVLDCHIYGPYRSAKVTRIWIQKGTAVHKLDVHRAVTYMGDSHRQAVVDEIKRLPAHGPNQYRSFESDNYFARWADETDGTWKWKDKKLK